MSILTEADLSTVKETLQKAAISSTDQLAGFLGVAALPQSLEELKSQFPFDDHPQYGFLWLWILGELAGLGVEWAVNLKGLTANFDLTEIPDNIGNLRNLQELNLNGNSLDQLPETIGNLENLLALYLGNNYLESLPETIGNLKNLETLELYYNHLDTLPESFGALQNLIRLNMNEVNDENPIVLPKSFGALHNLRHLEIIGNEDALTPELREQLKNCAIGS